MSVPVKVTILDKEFLVSCPEGEQASLLKSAEFLGERMREIRDTGKVVGIDRIAVMAALNLAHELLNSKGDSKAMADIRERLNELNVRIASRLE